MGHRLAPSASACWSIISIASNLSVSRDALQDAFESPAVMFGYLSSAYNWTYALLQLPSGLLLDRFGVRRVGTSAPSSGVSPRSPQLYQRASVACSLRAFS